MNRIEIPPDRDILTQTGDLLLRSWLKIHIWSSAGAWSHGEFRWENAFADSKTRLSKVREGVLPFLGGLPLHPTN